LSKVRPVFQSIFQSAFESPRCFKWRLALSGIGLFFFTAPLALTGHAWGAPPHAGDFKTPSVTSPSFTPPSFTSPAALFAGISNIQLIQNNRHTLSIHFDADLPFEYRLVPIDDHRIAIKLIQGKVSQKLKGPSIHGNQRQLMIEHLKGIENVTILNPFPGMAAQHPIEEIQISGKNIGKKSIVITGAQPADLAPAHPRITAIAATPNPQTAKDVSQETLIQSSPPLNDSSYKIEPFLRLSKTPSITSANTPPAPEFNQPDFNQFKQPSEAPLNFENGVENKIENNTENAVALQPFRQFDMKNQSDNKPKKQKPLEPDPKWQVPPRPSSNPERTVAQERLAVFSREDVPQSLKQSVPAREALRLVPQRKSLIRTDKQPGHIERPPHLTKDGRTEEGRFSSPTISSPASTSQSNQSTSADFQVVPDTHLINVSNTKTAAHPNREQFSPWSTFAPPNSIKPNPNAPPMQFSIIQTEPTAKRSPILKASKSPLVTHSSDGGILLQAVDASQNVNAKGMDSPILPASKQGLVAQALKRAWVHSKQGHYQEALLSLQQAKAISPSDASIHAAEGEVYLKMGALTQAKVAYEKAYALKPDEVFHERYAVILYQLGQKIESCHILENLVALNPQRPEAQLMLGTLYQEMGQPQKALVHLKHAVTMTPESADGQYNLATVWHSMGDTKQALRHYYQALQLSTTPKQQKEVQRVIQELLKANNPSPSNLSPDGIATGSRAQ
jgi:Flp pilus assembly protein TadD